MKVSAQELEFNLTSIDSQSLVQLRSNVSINLQGKLTYPLPADAFESMIFRTSRLVSWGQRPEKNEHENLKISP